MVPKWTLNTTSKYWEMNQMLKKNWSICTRSNIIHFTQTQISFIQICIMNPHTKLNISDANKRLIGPRMEISKTAYVNRNPMIWWKQRKNKCLKSSVFDAVSSVNLRCWNDNNFAYESLDYRSVGIVMFIIYNIRL